MAYTPATPYPKTRGDAIRSADWNDAVNEITRLETDKLNRSGGTVSGNLAVTGTISGTLANNIVGPNQIAANAVTSAKLADGNVTTAKIADGNVTGQKIANGTILVEKLFGEIGASGSVAVPPGQTIGVRIHADSLDTTSLPALSCPLLFATSNTSECRFNYTLEYRIYMSSAPPPEQQLQLSPVQRQLQLERQLQLPPQLPPPQPQRKLAEFSAWFKNLATVPIVIQFWCYLVRKP